MLCIKLVDEHDFKGCETQILFLNYTYTLMESLIIEKCIIYITQTTLCNLLESLSFPIIFCIPDQDITGKRNDLSWLLFLLINFHNVEALMVFTMFTKSEILHVTKPFILV